MEPPRGSRGVLKLAPYIVALMTELIMPDKDMRILEIGTGSDYQAAALAELCDNVFTIEINDTLTRRSREILNKLGYDYVKVTHGDGYKGWPEQAPFDAIIVTCAPMKVPQPIVDQLKEGGKTVIPYGEADAGAAGQGGGRHEAEESNTRQISTHG